MEKDLEFKKWKNQSEKNIQNQPKVVYEMIESSSSDEEIYKINIHKLATTKKIFWKFIFFYSIWLM